MKQITYIFNGLANVEDLQELYDHLNDIKEYPWKATGVHIDFLNVCQVHDGNTGPRLMVSADNLDIIKEEIRNITQEPYITRTGLDLKP